VKKPRRSNVVSLRFKPGVIRRLDGIADDNGTTKTAIIKRAVLEYLAKLPR
jgi:predicted transcriptional regulator